MGEVEVVGSLINGCAVIKLNERVDTSSRASNARQVRVEFEMKFCCCEVCVFGSM